MWQTESPAPSRVARAAWSRVNIVIGAVIVIVVTAIAVAAMLLVRRARPRGSYFQDGDRASGVFGVLATGFSVLLGFIIFLAFDVLRRARTGAETEATIVSQQMETAQYLPDDDRGAAHRPAHLLRTISRRTRMDRDRGRHPRRLDQPLERGDVQDPERLHASVGHRAVRVRPMDGPDHATTAGQSRSSAWCRGHHPDAVVDRAVRDRRHHLRLHAVLRRQRRRRRSRRAS